MMQYYDGGLRFEVGGGDRKSQDHNLLSLQILTAKRARATMRQSDGSV